jgi:hypothetical protein
VLSNSEVLKEVTTPEIDITAQTPYKAITGREWGLDTNGNATQLDVTTDTFNCSDMKFLVSADTQVSGSWHIDNFDYTDDFSDTDSFMIALSEVGEGTHTLNISGKDSDGDGFRVEKTFEVDTLPPKLLLSSPIKGSLFGEDGVFNIRGVTDEDAFFTVSVDGEVQIEECFVSELTGSINADGVFNFNINIDPGVSSHLVSITVSDKTGNQYTKEIKVQNIGLSNIDKIGIYADGIHYTNQNLVLNSSGSTTAALSLVGETQNSSFIINDSDLIRWDAMAVRGSAAIDDDGMLVVGANSIGYVTGSLKVAENASMTAAATFGADVYSKPLSDYHNLTLGADVGGKVSGSGNYAAGTEVSISAVPSAGYRFKKWRVSEGAVLLDDTSPQTTIIMPNSDVIIIAEFDYTNKTSKSSRSLESVTAKAGEKAFIPLNSKMDENNTVVCYTVNGLEHVIAMSTACEGKMYFIPPADGEYYLKEYETEFTDILGHWAKDYIDFVYARNLFNGVSNELFDPEGKMTRGMFVTVLGRLHGIDEGLYNESMFKDVKTGQWYTPFVAWASQNNIISGYGDNNFGLDDEITREQMCVILERYIKFAGNNLIEENQENIFDDSEKVSQWAQSSVKYAQDTGLVQGTDYNLFNPSDYATRAEVSAIFKRLVTKIIELR